MTSASGSNANYGKKRYAFTFREIVFGTAGESIMDETRTKFVELGFDVKFNTTQEVHNDRTYRVWNLSVHDPVI